MFSLVLLCHRNRFVDNYNWHTTREKKTVQDLLRKSTSARIVLVSLGCFEKFSFSLGATLNIAVIWSWNTPVNTHLHIYLIKLLYFSASTYHRYEQHVGQWVGWWIYQHGFFFHGAGAVKKWKKARKDALVIDCLIKQKIEKKSTWRSRPKEKLHISISCTKFGKMTLVCNDHFISTNKRTFMNGQKLAQSDFLWKKLANL